MRGGQLAPDGDLSGNLRSSIFALLQRITLGDARLSIELGAAALIDQLATLDQRLSGIKAAADTITIDVKAHRLRCGMQVKLIVGDAGMARIAPDPKLIKLVEDAHRWFDELRTGRVTSLSDIARRERVDAATVSRTVGLAFLAPEIVTSILDGRQPPNLTAERLKRAVPLPLRWREQHEVFGPRRS